MDGVGLGKDTHAEGLAHALQQMVKGRSMLDAAEAQGGASVGRQWVPV